MYPVGCRTGYTTGRVAIFKDGKGLYSFKVQDFDNYDFIRDNWPAGKYDVFVKVNWVANDVRDFAFRAFLPSAAKF